MAPYKIESYNMTLPEEEKKKYRGLATIQLIFLLKRFESSIEAIRVSLANKLRMYEYMQKMLDAGRILRVKDFNKVVTKWSRLEIEEDSEEQDREEEFVREVEGIATAKAGKDYDTDGMARDIKDDIQILQGLRRRVDEIRVDKKLEAVRDCIIKEKALEHESRKVLIFTEYTATARYIFKRLREEFPKKRILLIHGGTKIATRQRYIKRFSPRANLLEDERMDDPEVDMLISTEVLSEGQNLQDCNYVINYDLPWNPMRIVQRTGRIDRLTSSYETVHSRACYPDKQLDGILKLMGKLISKIDVVNEILGLDTELLGKLPNPKQYGGRLAHDIRALAGLEGGAKSVIERLSSESDLMPSTPINEIVRHVKEIGFDAMSAIPFGRRSGLPGEGQKAILAYQQKREPHRFQFVLYDYESNSADVPENDLEAIRLGPPAQSRPRHTFRWMRETTI